MNGKWNFEKLSEYVLLAIINIILNIPIRSSKNDIIMFKNASNGNFNLMAVWHTFRTPAQKFDVFNKIWRSSIHILISVFIWRILEGFIPVDSQMKKIGFSLPSKCQCCFQIEDINHIFISNPIAMKVWFWLEDLFKINIFKREMTCMELLIARFRGHAKNHICIIFPMLALWYL